MHQTITDHQKKLKRLVDTCDEHRADVRHTSDKQRSFLSRKCVAQIRRLESSLNELRRTQRDPVSMFGGEAIQRLLAAIQRMKVLNTTHLRAFSFFWYAGSV